MSGLPRLHVPDEPIAARHVWRDRVLAGEELDVVVTGDGGIADWFFGRWRVVTTVGLDQPAFVSLVGGYRRELWLWLVGERTWEQCCAGLIGRIGRRAGVAS
jgi:hypothetical protein